MEQKWERHIDNRYGDNVCIKALPGHNVCIKASPVHLVCIRTLSTHLACVRASPEHFACVKTSPTYLAYVRLRLQMVKNILLVILFEGLTLFWWSFKMDWQLSSWGGMSTWNHPCFRSGFRVFYVQLGTCQDPQISVYLGCHFPHS